MFKECELLKTAKKLSNKVNLTCRNIQFEVLEPRGPSNSCTSPHSFQSSTVNESRRNLICVRSYARFRYPRRITTGCSIQSRVHPQLEFPTKKEPNDTKAITSLTPTILVQHIVHTAKHLTLNQSRHNSD